jgi:transcriptional regulator with XRE-family HTH domain
MQKEDPFHTGEKLRKLSEFHDYTQEYVASEIGIAPNTLSDNERGKAFPSRDALQSAAQLFKVDVTVFFSTERLIFNLQNNQQANGYVRDQHNVDKELIERFMAFIRERDERVEGLLARAIDRLGKAKPRG